jgi:hypothetical protein
MIRKPTIIITSLGRTATKFFAALFGDLIPDATSIHEPDVFNFFQYEGTAERLRQTVKQIQEVGFYNLFVRKAFGSGSVIDLSDARVRNKLEYEEAVRRLLEQRSSFVNSRAGSIYVESNIGYYGLIDVLKDVYAHHKVAYVVRDGRDWVQSHMSWGEMYGKGRIRSLIAHTWPAASDINGDPYAAEWDSMSRFERLCWAWGRLNDYALHRVEENPRARIFRFEHIFKSKDRYRHFQDMIHFVTTLPGIEPIGPDSLAGWLDRKIHKSQNYFPAWEEWSEEQKQIFETLCSTLMEKLGYGPPSS